MLKRIFKLFFIISIFLTSLNHAFAVEEGASCAKWEGPDKSNGDCTQKNKFGAYAKYETTPGGFYKLKVPYEIVVSCTYTVGQQNVFDQFTTGNANPYYNNQLVTTSEVGTNPEPVYPTLYLSDNTYNHTNEDRIEMKAIKDDKPKISSSRNVSGSDCVNKMSCGTEIPGGTSGDNVKSVLKEDGNSNENPDRVFKVYDSATGTYNYYYQPAGLRDTNKGILLQASLPISWTSEKQTKCSGKSESVDNGCNPSMSSSTPCASCPSLGSAYSQGIISSSSSVTPDPSKNCTESTSKAEKKVCPESNGGETGDSNTDSAETSPDSGGSKEGENCKMETCSVVTTKCDCCCTIQYSTMKITYSMPITVTVTYTYTGDYIVPLNTPPEFSNRFEPVNGKFIPLSTLTGDYKYTVSFNEDGSEAIGICDLSITDSTPDKPTPDIPWNKLIGFRQVDLSNMFPGRTPKKNWQGYDTSIKIVRSTNSPMYVINLSSEKMREIAKSNSLKTYIDWGSELNYKGYHPVKIVEGVKIYSYEDDYKSNFVSDLANKGIVKRYEDNIIARNKYLIANGYNEYYTNLDYIETEDGEQE